ncbi:MAG: GvpL/GvpF family gas vesicle protein [Labilithrix sp.]|nr:GvpL/GvpF family gas vesicle protein [Labilithrix sp.]
MNRRKRSSAALVAVTATPRARRVKGSAAEGGAAPSESRATYVYCVVKSARASKLVRAPKGIDGAGTTRLLDAGDGYRLVVTSAPLALYDAAAIDARLRDIDWVGGRAAEHEAVVEHAGGLGTVVPMKLFTLFSTDERAVEHVRKMKRSLDRVVERIAGCEEWGLRILFDEARAARAVAEEARARKVVSGTSFLLRKKALDAERRTLGARGAAEVDDLYGRLVKTARSAQRRAAPNRELSGRVLLDAVFLVPRASVKKLKATVGASAERLVAEGFDITLTGPWPAYSFIGAR